MTSLVAAAALLVAAQAPGPARGDVKARPISSPRAEVDVRQVSRQPARFEIAIRPLDMLGRPFGPGRGAEIDLSASAGTLLGTLNDAEDGRYTQVLELAGGQAPSGVELEVRVAGVLTRAPLVRAPDGDAADPLVSERVAQARADLAARLETDADGIEVLDASRVTWRDGSLGCPKPGMSYTLALVPGVRVRLRVDGTVYAYHGRREGSVALCESPAEPIPVRTR